MATTHHGSALELFPPISFQACSVEGAGGSWHIPSYAVPWRFAGAAWLARSTRFPNRPVSIAPESPVHHHVERGSGCSEKTRLEICRLTDPSRRGPVLRGLRDLRQQRVDRRRRPGEALHRWSVGERHQSSKHDESSAGKAALQWP